MICQRCGYCCIRLCIVAPDYSLFPECDEPCKFLSFKDNRAVCAIHGDDIYKGSPCEEYQSHWPTSKCRVGNMIVTKHPEMIEEYIKIVEKAKKIRHFDKRI